MVPLGNSCWVTLPTRHPQHHTHIGFFWNGLQFVVMLTRNTQTYFN